MEIYCGEIRCNGNRYLQGFAAAIPITSAQAAQAAKGAGRKARPEQRSSGKEHERTRRGPERTESAERGGGSRDGSAGPHQRRRATSAEQRRDAAAVARDRSAGAAVADGFQVVRSDANRCDKNRRHWRFFAVVDAD